MKINLFYVIIVAIILMGVGAIYYGQSRVSNINLTVPDVSPSVAGGVPAGVSSVSPTPSQASASTTTLTPTPTPVPSITPAQTPTPTMTPLPTPTPTLTLTPTPTRTPREEDDD